jgi:hypothetical protein
MTFDLISTLVQIRLATTLVSTRLFGLRPLQCGLTIVEAWPALCWPSTLKFPCQIVQVSHPVVPDSHLIALASKTKKKNQKLLLLSALLDLQVVRLQMVVLPRGFRCLVATFFL